MNLLKQQMTRFKGVILLGVLLVLTASYYPPIPGPTTGTLSNVSSSATNVTLLASNASRKGGMLFNDSSQILYVKLAATASTTSYTVQIAAGGYYEIPFNYTGILDGIWASANGAARVTELT